MANFGLVSEYEMRGDQPEAVATLVDSLKAGNKYQTLEGVTGSGKTFSMANVIQQHGQPTLVLSHNKTLAAQLYNELKSFFPNNAVEYFVSYYDYYQPEAYIPTRDLFIEKDSSVNEAIDRLRLAATSALMSRKDTIIVASVSCIYGLGSPDDYLEMTVGFRVGDVINRDEVLRGLVDIQYDRSSVDFKPGVFRIRGDNIDIFPAYAQEAIRLEMFDDEIEAIYWIDPRTGEMLQSLDKVVIFPAKHFVTPEEKTKKAMVTIEEELVERLKVLDKAGKMLEANRLESRTRYDLDMMKEIGHCKGVENYARHFSGRKPGETPYTLIDFFPEGFLTIIDESHVTLPQVHGMFNGDQARKTTLVEHGFRLPSALDNRPMKYHEFMEKTDQVVFVSATPSKFEIENSTSVATQVIRPTGLVDPPIEIRPAEGQVLDVMEELKRVVAEGHRAIITTLTKRMAEDLTKYLAEREFKVGYLHSDIDTLERIEILQALRAGAIDVVIGVNLLREGLDLPEVAFVAILDADREGFLRSETSLIQTIGRAARHVNSTVVLYADVMTGSIERTIKVTDSRRAKQMAYNKANGITPTGIQRKLQMRLAELEEARKVAEAPMAYGALADDERSALAQTVEEEMLKAARDLRFEDAAKLRDELDRIRSGEDLPGGGYVQPTTAKGKKKRKRRVSG